MQSSIEYRGEVLMYLHDERKCLTTRWASRNFGISREAAANLFEDALRYQLEKNQKFDGSYEVTRVCVEKMKGNEGDCVTDVKRKRVSLRKELINLSHQKTKIQQSNASQGSIYSICFQSDPNYSTPTVQSAHEQDMLSIRDDLFQNKVSIETIFDTNLLTSSIRPAKQICMNRKIPELMRSLRLQPLTNSQNKEPNTQSSSVKKTVLPPRKVTTAASFFGNHKTSSSKEKSKKTNITIGASVNNRNLNKNTNKKKTTKVQDKSDDDDADDDDVFSGDDTITKDGSMSINNQNEEKEFKLGNKTEERRSKRILEQGTMTKKKNQKQKLHGNADDFVGDEDEDEDDVKDDIERRKRIALEERKEIRKKAIQTNQKSQVKKTKQLLKNKKSLSEDEHEYDDINVVDEKKPTSKPNNNFGSMDDFTQKVDKSSMDINMKRKRQRKKMVEKTSVDSKGYMHTETVAVWETIPSDEENDDEEAKSIDSGNVERKKQKTLGTSSGNKSNMNKTTKSDVRKNTKNMKQTGLMGFFAKK